MSHPLDFSLFDQSILPEAIRALLRKPETKDTLRTALKAARKERVELEAKSRLKRLRRHQQEWRIQRLIAKQLLRYSPRTVAAYIPMPGEIDLSRLMLRMHKLGWRIALPCIEPGNDVLIFRCWYPGVELVQGKFGIWQPAPSEQDVIPDTILMPLLGFDRFGQRIGMGAGWYDRTLAALISLGHHPLTVGIAYDEQEVMAVPHEPHDMPMQGVITPTRVVDCAFFNRL